MEINKGKILAQVKDEFAGHCSTIVQTLIEHFAYSVADIESYDELTDTEKQIISKETFNKLTEQ